MNHLRKILVIIAIVAVSTIEAVAQPHEYRFSFEVGSRADLDSLSQMISIDRVEGSRVWAYANPQEMELFRQTGISFELCAAKGSAKAIPMAASVAQMENLDRYPTYEVYDTLMRNFVRDYPQLCQLEEVATLSSGRKMLALKISNNVDLDNTDKPEVLCTATMHGDEGICATTALNFCNYLLGSYGTDSYVNRLLDSIEFWIIPIYNPDGMYSDDNSSISGSTRSNGNGYDLNRNFPKVSGGGNTMQSETRAMIEFFGRHHFSLSTNLHAGNECFNYPWDTWSRLTADNAWWRYVGGAYRDTAQHYGSSGYFDDGCDNSANGLTNGYAWYSVAGGQQDWANYFAHCREVTIEVCGSKEPTSTTTIANIWRYNKNSLLNFYAESLNGVRGKVTNAAGEPLAARITIEEHDKDNSWIETDARVGDYHRMLKGGTYNLTFEADGYDSQTIAVNVIDGKPTWLNVTLYKEAARLSVSSSNISVALPPTSQTTRQITISNLGSSAGEYSISGNIADWLTFDHTSGQLDVGQSNTLTATINSQWLGLGSYSTMAFIQSSVSQTITLLFSLEIKDVPDEIGFASLPQKLEYSIGDALDVSGGMLSLRFCNDSVACIPMTRQMVNGFNSSTPGVKTLEVTVDDLTIYFKVIIRDNVTLIPDPVVISSVIVEKLPDKLKYDIGDTLDVAGGVLVAIFSDGSTDTVAMQNSMVSGFSSEVVGTVLLTINYEYFINIFSISVIDLSVPPVQPTVVSAVLTTLPLKLEYTIGQVIDVGGGLLTVTYSNDSTVVKALQSSMIKDFDSSKAGLQWVTIEYAGTFNMFCVEIKSNTSDTTGIDDHWSSQPRIYAVGRQIVVENANAPIKVYDLAGRCVAVECDFTSIARITLDHGGIYIVTVGATKEKVNLRQ